ncbi:F-box only protein 15-like isoform X2 [Echeneis naucrates]|uniref:F-box only protein 15-like isoform X2 n=1 Tax=Echeneis naucrates TaxID=173247 RepID=UPI001113EC16|nr:F-box only protein 15-like isoform X2 [Echeneis naucrates]
MAAGRGEFFRSLLEGLERKPPNPDPRRGRPCPRRGQPGQGRGQPGQRGGQPGQAAGKRTERRWTTPRPSGGSDKSRPGPIREKEKSDFHQIKTCSSKENLVERLPSEILIKILSYLDVSSLFCISHVSKLFHQLANDEVMWYKIYASEFGGQTWKLRSADDAAVKEGPVEVGDLSLGHWKRVYFRTAAGQEMGKWRRELRDISPYTGLPRQTENLNVSWELTVCDCLGQESMLQHSRAYFFESSVIVRWNGGDLASYHHISSIQLHGVRKEAMKRPRKPGWRSLILKLDMKAEPGCFIGKDRLIKLMHLTPGVIIGVWRGQSSVAFIMVSLHFHKLVEKSLLGSPACPYSEPVDRPPVYDLDPEFGLHGYTLHFVLHNTGTEIMSGYFRQLSCHTVQIQRGLVELRVIDRTNLSQHRSLSGHVKLPWKSNELEGSVENCCIMTLTLLDEFHKPFWCVSSPICITMAKMSLSFDYSGEHFLMNYQNPEGQVKMKLVWLKEQKQFFLISLTVYVSLSKVNQHFSRDY